LRKNQLRDRFRRQFPIPPYIVDFACVEARLIVECDGGQHAQSSGDNRRDARLRREGWHILRFWNNEILGNLDGVLYAISQALALRERVDPHPNPPPLAGEGVHSEG
jgi:primosomal protein N' (replication factor Y)